MKWMAAGLLITGLCACDSFSESGDYLVIDLSGGPDAQTYPVSYYDAVPADGWTDEYKTTKLVLRRIPAGTFTMGSPEDELGRGLPEKWVEEIRNALEEVQAKLQEIGISVEEIRGPREALKEAFRRYAEVEGYSRQEIEEGLEEIEDMLLVREYIEGDPEAQREVTLTRDFYIGVFEVTQRQWERVMGDWPSYFRNPAYRESRPVENVSWDDIRGGTWPGDPAGSGQPDADSFIGRISTRTGLTFDLPTEAQWEYACRAGTTTALNSGKNLTDTDRCPNMAEVGRYEHNHPGGFSWSSGVSTDGGTAKVGSYLPNAWGLYDMHGNVWEWCLDWFAVAPFGTTDPFGALSGSDRFIRGGSWSNIARHLRCGFVFWDLPADAVISRGFRAVCR